MKYQFTTNYKFLTSILAAAGLIITTSANASLPKQADINMQEQLAEKILSKVVSDPELIELLEKAKLEGLTEQEYEMLKQEFIEMVSGPNLPFV